MIKTKRIGSKLTPRICKCCGKGYTPARPLQKACSLACALELGKDKTAEDKAKADRKELREGREKQKTRTDWMREAQTAVNKYVRMRDAHLGCVSCDKPASWGGQWHASHFRSVGAASSLRFNLWNIHKSCSVCNNWKSGNLIDYEPRLKEKIGDERVDWLRAQNQRVEYSIEYLRRLKKVFTKRAKLQEERMRHEMQG